MNYLHMFQQRIQVSKQPQIPRMDLQQIQLTNQQEHHLPHPLHLYGVKLEFPVPMGPSVKRKRESEMHEEVPRTPAVKRRRRSPKNEHKITSKYVGVHWNSQKKRWIAKRKMNRTQLHGGTFIDELEAARAADDLVIKHRAWELELNFPSKAEVEQRRKLLQQKTKHGYFGIVKSSNGKWLASRTISSNGKTISAVCGKSRDNIEDAARDSDKIWLENGGDKYRVNFPVKQEVLTENENVEESGRLIPGTIVDSMSTPPEYESSSESVTNSEESSDEEFQGFESIGKMKKKILNSKQEAKYWKKELKNREKQFKRDKEMLQTQLRRSEQATAADRKALETKYKKKLADEKKKHKSIVNDLKKSKRKNATEMQLDEVEELKQQIVRNEELFKLKLEVSRQALLGEKKVNEQLEARLEELKKDKQGLFEEVGSLRQYRAIEVKKEEDRHTANLKLQIEHLQYKLKDQGSIVSDIKEKAELKLKYELLKKEIEVKKLKEEIEILKKSQNEKPMCYPA